jgi:hypothetical protein
VSRTHGRADVYLGDDLTWTEAVVTEQPTISKLIVKAKRDDHPSAYVIVLTLDEVTYLGQSNGAKRWTGLNDGGEVTLTLVPRRTGCQSCGG